MIRKIITDSFIEIVSKMSGIQLELISQDADSGLLDIAGIMNLNGRDGGTVLVSASERDMRIFCANMTGVTEESVHPDDITDAICELVNVTAGSMKLRLGGNSLFSLSTPFSLEGRQMNIAVKKRTQVSAIALGNGELTFKIIFILD